MHFAAGGGHLAVVALLLKQPGIDVNAADNTGRTILHNAASMDCKEVLELLLNQPGIDAKAADKDGWTAWNP